MWSRGGGGQCYWGGRAKGLNGGCLLITKPLSLGLSLCALESSEGPTLEVSIWARLHCVYEIPDS